MECIPTKPRWLEGSSARVVHALGLWLTFLSIVHLTRLVLFPYLGLIGGVLGFFLCYGGVLGFLLMRVGRVGARDLGITGRNWAREVGLGLVGFAGISALLLGWVWATGGTDGVRSIVINIANFTWADRAQFLVIGLLAASAEETLFRGYIQPTLMTRFGPGIGILATICLFMVHHFNDWPTVERVGSLFITGLGFGVLRWQNRSLIGSYTAHTVLWLIWGTT